MIRTKCWNDSAEPDDGTRLLVCRYRPRALPKKDETWDLWWKQLGPSRELHAALYGKRGTPPSFADFKSRYLKEMADAEPKALIRRLAEKHAAGETITLLCSSACVDPTQCHRTILQQLIEAEAATITGCGNDVPPP